MFGGLELREFQGIFGMSLGYAGHTFLWLYDGRLCQHEKLHWLIKIEVSSLTITTIVPNLVLAASQ